MAGQSYHHLKTYLASFCAVQMVPGIVITEHPSDKPESSPNAHYPGGALFRCEVNSEINPECKFAAAFGHSARLLVRYSEADAMAEALRQAHQFFPVENEWTGHSVTLTEIPRSTFIQMELFITAREIYHRLLRLAGFR